MQVQARAVRGAHTIMQVGTDPWKLVAAPTTAPIPVTVPSSPGAYPLLSSGALCVQPIVDPASGALDVSATFLASGPFGTIDSVKTAISTDLSVAGRQVATGLEFDMRTATLTLTRTAGEGGDGLRVVHALRVLQQAPHVIMQTIDVSTLSSEPLSEIIRLEHEMRGSGDDAALEFSGVLSANGGVQTYMSLAVGDRCACAAGFALPEALTLLDLPEHSEPGVSGGGKRRAHSTLLLQPDGEASSVRIVLYTSTHGPNKAALAKRGVMSAVAVDAAAHLARHQALWAAKWETAVDVPFGASDRLRSALAYAAYNLHARAHAFGALSNPAGALGRDDDFIVPALMFVAPDAARALLDGRAAPAERAMAEEGAELYALDGVRYPYGPLERRQAALVGGGSSSSFPASASDAPLVAVHGVIRLHATYMVAVNAWNYYRVTGDKEWLSATGYGLIGGAANAIASLAATDDGGATYRLEGAVALTDTSTVSATDLRDTVLVTAGCIAALKAACEAAYALGYRPERRWLDVRFGLNLPTLSADKAGAPLSAPLPLARYLGDDLAAELATAAAATAGGYRVAQQAPEEVLLALAEPLGTLVEADLGFNVLANIVRNYDLWGKDPDVADGLMVSSGTTAPGEAVRKLVRLLSMAQAMQVDATLTAAFLADLEAFLDAHSDLGAGGFGNLSRRGGGGSAWANDAELSALLLLVFVCGIGGGMVQGGYGESGLEYATLGVSLGTSAVMPAAWERLVITGVGGGAGMGAVLMNRGLVGTVDPGGSTVTVGAGGTNVVYWSTETLSL